MEWIKAESSPPKPRLSPKLFHYWNSPIYISFKLLGKGQITIGKVNSLGKLSTGKDLCPMVLQ